MVWRPYFHLGILPIFRGELLFSGRVLGETRIKLDHAGIGFRVERYQVATEFH